MTFVAGTVKRTGVTNIATTIDATISGDGSTPIDANDIVGGLTTKTVAFAANDTADKTVSWEVVGDSANEPDEGFKIVLSNPSSPGGTISVPVARGTIMNDDNSAPATIFGPATTADTTFIDVGSVSKYKITGTLIGGAWKIFFGCEADGSPGAVIKHLNSTHFSGYTVGADGSESLNNNANFKDMPDTGTARAFEVIHDRAAKTVSVSIGGNTPFVYGEPNAASSFARFLSGSGAQPSITIAAVS